MPENVQEVKPPRPQREMEYFDMYLDHRGTKDIYGQFADESNDSPWQQAIWKVGSQGALYH